MNFWAVLNDACCTNAVKSIQNIFIYKTHFTVCMMVILNRLVCVCVVYTQLERAICEQDSHYVLFVVRRAMLTGAGKKTSIALPHQYRVLSYTPHLHTIKVRETFIFAFNRHSLSLSGKWFEIIK